MFILKKKTKNPIIERCREDLCRNGIEVIPFPDYIEREEEDKLIS